MGIAYYLARLGCPFIIYCSIAFGRSFYWEVNFSDYSICNLCVHSVWHIPLYMLEKGRKARCSVGEKIINIAFGEPGAGVDGGELADALRGTVFGRRHSTPC
jgi:hypothetical protein